MQFKLITFAEEPELEEPADAVVGSVWPEFMLNDDIAVPLWFPMIRAFPDFQFSLVDESNGEIAAVGNSIPFFWDGRGESLPDRGWDAVFQQGIAEKEAGIPPTALSALSASVSPRYQQRGLSKEVVLGMRKLANRHGLQSMVAPVRPSLKSAYPLIPMERYLEWENKSSEPFDPWIRVHRRLGGRIVKIAPESMRVTNTVAQWEKWTGMRFPGSGSHIVPGALQPVDVNVEDDRVVYTEPNVWVRHDVP